MKLLNKSVIFLLFVLFVNPANSDTKPPQLIPPPAQVKSPVELCAEKKLKEYKKRNMVTIEEEKLLLENYKKACMLISTVRQEQELFEQRQGHSAAKNSGDNSKATPPPPKPPVAPPKPAAAPPPGGARAVIGGCGSQEQCDAYMAEAAKPKYGWKMPVPFMYGPMDAYPYRGGGFDMFELPANACGASNQGDLIAVDFGDEVRAVACMGPDVTMDQMIEKIKNTKVETLPQVTAVKKTKYEWVVTKPQPPLEEGEVVICNGTPGTCSKEIVGKEVDMGAKCPAFKCVRIDGGPIKKKDAK